MLKWSKSWTIFLLRSMANSKAARYHRAERDETEALNCSSLLKIGCRIRFDAVKKTDEAILTFASVEIRRHSTTKDDRRHIVASSERCIDVVGDATLSLQ